MEQRVIDKSVQDFEQLVTGDYIFITTSTGDNIMYVVDKVDPFETHRFPSGVEYYLRGVVGKDAVWDYYENKDDILASLRRASAIKEFQVFQTSKYTMEVDFIIKNREDN